MTGSETGEAFGPYLLQECLGAGGMGEVYRAWDTRRTRYVALKRLLPAYTADEGFESRFRREAALVAQLAEPHIVPVHDFGEIDGRLYLDMRLVDGPSAAEMLTGEGPMRPARAVALVVQIASALDAAHAEGLVHRDVKPSNMLVTGPSEFCYLVDFGIVRAIDGTGATSLTLTGASVGSPPYMAPERFLDEPDRPGVDVYALGCVLYELLTGEQPFDSAEALPQQIHAHLHEIPPAPSTRVQGVPPALDAVVAAALAKRPDERPPSAGALARAARAAVDDRPRAPVTVDAPGVAGPVAAPGVSTPGWRRDGADAVRERTGPAAGPGPGPVNAGDGAGSRDDARATGSAEGRTIGRRSGSRRRAWAVVSGAAAVAVAVLVALLIAGSGQDPPQPRVIAALGTPERAVPVGTGPGPVAVAPTGADVYVANQGSKSVSVVDQDTGRLRATWPLSGEVSGLAIGPDGSTAAVVLDGGLALVETASGRTRATIPVDNHPTNVVLSPDGRTAYVAQDGSVSQIDLVSQRIIGRAVAEAFEGGLVLAPDGRRLYLTSGGMLPGVLTVVSTANMSVIATIKVGETAISPTLSPDGTRVYVPNQKSSTLAVVDTATLATTATVRLRTGPAVAIPAPDGRRVYVLRYGEPHYTLAVVDSASNTVVSEAPLGVAADSAAVNRDGTRLFLTAPDDNTLVVAATGV